jgi:PAS domain S-box-containing protein
MAESTTSINRPWIRKRSHPYLSALLAVVVGLVITAFAFVAVQNNERRHMKTDFDRLAVERTATIQQNLHTFFDVVASMRLLFYSAEGMTRDEFRVLAGPLMEHHPGMQALEWAPRVRHHERDRYVQSAREDGFENFEIMENLPAGLVPRSRQAEYYPVYYVEPFERNRQALGYDLASDCLRRYASERARDSGRAVATSRISLIRQADPRFGFLVFLSVYDHDHRSLRLEERRQSLLGFILGVFDTEEVLSASLSQFAPEGLDIMLTDLSAAKDNRLLGIWDSEGLVYKASGTLDLQSRGSIPFHRKTEFDLAGRTWQVTCAATPAFFSDKESRLPWVIFFGGMAFSLLTSVYLLRSAERTSKLRDSESRYRTLVENAPEAIVILDADTGHFVDANQNAGDLFKTSREELLKLGPVNLSPPRQPDGSDSRETAPKVIAEALEGGSPVFEWLHIDVCGKEIPCEIRLVRLASRRRNLVRGSITDISERKRATEERQLLERKLHEAQKLESLGLLTSGIAHDFNNLLTPIMGRAGLALDELPSDTQARQHVEDIRISAMRAGELIHQLLAYTGQANIEPSKICLNSAIREMARLWEVSLSAETEIEFQLSEEDPVIEGDAGQIRQVILNLITNAADAIAERGGTIRLSSGVTEADRRFLSGLVGDPELPLGRYAWLEVHDTGKGMDGEIRGRIFDPFFTTKQEGRGLGLATVLGIVKTHGGGVAVSSERDMGTTMKVVFPSVEGPAEARPEKEVASPRTLADGAILVVDDEEHIRTLITAILKREGFEVVQAASGPKALEAFETNGNDIRLVLIDHAMPGMSGVDVFSRIRKIQSEVPVILMSGYGERTMLSRVSAEGLAGFLQKPFDPKRLLEAVHKALELV